MHRRVTVVGSVGRSLCLSVCLSVKSHLTSGASVRPENSVTYSAGNRGPKICGVFSETSPFKSYGVICLPMTSYEVLRGMSGIAFECPMGHWDSQYVRTV